MTGRLVTGIPSGESMSGCSIYGGLRRHLLFNTTPVSTAKGHKGQKFHWNQSNSWAWFSQKLPEGTTPFHKKVVHVDCSSHYKRLRKPTVETFLGPLLSGGLWVAVTVETRCWENLRIVLSFLHDTAPWVYPGAVRHRDRRDRNSDISNTTAWYRLYRS